MKNVKDAHGREANPNEVILYTAKWCEACKRRVPKIMKKAQAAGLQVKLIDWDEDLSTLDRERLIARVEYVPYIDYLGREIDEEELDSMCRGHQLGERALGGH